MGNLSVSLLVRAWGSPIVELLRKSSRFHELTSRREDHRPGASRAPDPGRAAQAGHERSALCRSQPHARPDARDRGTAGRVAPDRSRSRPGPGTQRLAAAGCAIGADGMEDYIGWAVVETKPGQWDWSFYQENSREIHKAGLKYIPSVWVQNLPSWVRHGSDYRFATCLEHGKASEYLSVFSPKTVEAYDRVFAAAQRGARARRSTPCGSARQPTTARRITRPAPPAGGFPSRTPHMGWWAGEPEAKQHFLHWVETKYGTVDRLNTAWGTQHTSFEVDYPRDTSSPRRWLDFVAWYHEALIERLGVLFDVARKHFPETPICVNLGWPFEKVVLGQDLTGLVKMLASKGMIVRTPTGPFVSQLYTRRVATAARFYHAPRLSSEPVDGNAPVGEIAGRCSRISQPVSPGTSTTRRTWNGLIRPSSTCKRCRATPIRVSMLPSSSPRPHTGWKTGTTGTRGSRGATPKGCPPGWKACATSSTTMSSTSG